MQSQLASSAESALRISKGAPKAGYQIIGVICFAHKKCKSGALGAARSSQKVCNVRTARPQPRCIMPDRSMCSRSWHPAQKAHSESAKEHQKSRPPNNRCHLLRTQKVQNRCARSRPMAQKGVHPFDRLHLFSARSPPSSAREVLMRTPAPHYSRNRLSVVCSYASQATSITIPYFVYSYLPRPVPPPCPKGIRYTKVCLSVCLSVVPCLVYFPISIPSINLSYKSTYNLVARVRNCVLL